MDENNQFLSQLKQAVVEGNLDELKRLEDSYVKFINGPEANGFYLRNIQYDLMSVAVEKKYLEVIEFFISKGIDLGFTSFEKDRPLLQKAVATKNAKLVEVFLESGAEVNQIDMSGFDIADALLPSICEQGTNALHLAAAKGSKEIVEQLLSYGADITATDHFDVTAIHFASSRGHLPIVKFLFVRDPSLVDCRCAGGMLALDYAIQNGQKEVTLFLLDCPYENQDLAMRQALCIACSSAQLGIVEILANRGVELNFIPSMDEELAFETPLHSAVGAKAINVIKFLLKRGADVTATNAVEEPVLHVAIRYGSIEIIKLLINHKADILAKYSNGYTPFGSLLKRLSWTNNHNWQENISIAQFLIKWLVKTSFYNLEDWTNDFNAISNHSQPLSNYWSSCVEEMRVIKEESIDDTCVKYADILESCLFRLSSFARNKTIVKVLNSKDLDTKFPIYAPLLREAFEKGLERRQLLEKARRVFCSLFDKNDCKLPNLPEMFTDSVFICLSNDDLLNLTQ